MITRTRLAWKYKWPHSYTFSIANCFIMIALFAGVNNAEPTILPASVDWKSYSTTGLQLTGENKGKKYAVDLEPLNVWDRISEDEFLKSVNLTGHLVHFQSQDSGFDPGSIVLISCDRYMRGEDGRPVTNDVVGLYAASSAQEPAGLVFYTLELDTCIFSSNSTSEKSLFAIVSKHSARALLEIARKSEAPVEVHLEYNSDHMVPSLVDNLRPKEGTGGTAVALIVLYAITGVITMFFIIILVTGAIRAHRNPERYEETATERALTGRQRQSRARGIARAALETIPIVRFGTKPVEQAPKQLDVEMQESTSNLGSGEPTPVFHAEQPPRLPTPALLSHTDDSVTSMAITTTTPISSFTPLPYASTPPVSTTTPTPGATTPAPGTMTPAELDPSQLRCPVCLDDFEDGQELRVLPCKHSFHPDCIDPWLLNVAGSCPLCRIDLRPPEGRGEQQPFNLPPSPPPLPAHYRSNSSPGRLNSQLLRLVDVSRTGMTREERLSALRDVMAEDHRRRGGNGEPTLPLPVTSLPPPRSRRPELGVSRLRRALFGSGERSDSRDDNNEGDLRVRRHESRSSLIDGAAPIVTHSSAEPSTTTMNPRNNNS